MIASSRRGDQRLEGVALGVEALGHAFEDERRAAPSAAGAVVGRHHVTRAAMRCRPASAAQRRRAAPGASRLARISPMRLGSQALPGVGAALACRSTSATRCPAQAKAMRDAATHAARRRRRRRAAAGSLMARPRQSPSCSRFRRLRRQLGEAERLERARPRRRSRPRKRADDARAGRARRGASTPRMARHRGEEGEAERGVLVM